jgi:hypothetical protein
VPGGHPCKGRPVLLHHQVRPREWSSTRGQKTARRCPTGVNRTERETKLFKAESEFHHYIKINLAFIPNYGNRYRHGETITTPFAESTVNQVVSKQMVKKQQMRWTQRGGAPAAAGPHAGLERRPPTHLRALVAGPEGRHCTHPGGRRIAPGLARPLWGPSPIRAETYGKDLRRASIWEGWEPREAGSGGTPRHIAQNYGAHPVLN